MSSPASGPAHDAVPSIDVVVVNWNGGDLLDACLRSLVEDAGGVTAVYRVTGELFFASSNDLSTQFDYAGDPDRVVIDLSRAHVWDASTVATLDAITTKYERRGTTVEIVGLDPASAERHERLSGGLSSH